MRLAGLTFLTLLILAVPVFSAPNADAVMHDISGSLGLTMPREGLHPTDDVGISFHLGANGRIGRFRPLSVRLEANGIFFGSDQFLVPVDDGGITYLGVEDVSSYYISGHLGLRLGCDDPGRSFRPWVSLSPGVYLALNSNRVTIEDTGREVVREDRLQVCFGGRATVGGCFYPSSTWGLSLEFAHDIVLGLEKPLRYDATRGFVSESTTGRFYSLMVGIVIPFETLR